MNWFNDLQNELEQIRASYELVELITSWNNEIQHLNLVLKSLSQKSNDDRDVQKLVFYVLMCFSMLSLFWCIVWSLTISGYDPSVLINELRVKMSRYESPRTNQRGPWGGPNFGKEAAKAAWRQHLFEGAYMSLAHHLKGKIFPSNTGFSRTFLLEIEFQNQDLEVPPQRASISKILPRHLKVQLDFIKEVQIV